MKSRFFYKAFRFEFFRYLDKILTTDGSDFLGLFFSRKAEMMRVAPDYRLLIISTTSELCSPEHLRSARKSQDAPLELTQRENMRNVWSIL